MGRTNFGDKMMRKKGLVGRVLLDGKIHFNWKAYPLEMDNPDNLEFTKNKIIRGFFKSEFEVDIVSDTFLRLDNFTKGFVLINGFNIGRYWDIGPQKTLYVPAGILKKGKNEIITFESDLIKGEPKAVFTDKYNLG